MTILKFLSALAIMQLSHAFIVVALDGDWAERRALPILCAVLIDASLLFVLLGG
jgi:hypothetical protein